MAESPKVAIRHDRHKAVLYFLSFHAIPLGVSIFLIFLNIWTRFCGTGGSRIGLFQFAAKAHEVLMQLSIATVMAAYLQYLLTQKQAVPFGAIFSAYQVTQMSYLLSPEF